MVHFMYHLVHTFYFLNISEIKDFQEKLIEN